MTIERTEETQGFYLILAFAGNLSIRDWFLDSRNPTPRSLKHLFDRLADLIFDAENPVIENLLKNKTNTTSVEQVQELDQLIEFVKVNGLSVLHIFNCFIHFKFSLFSL